ncbi:phage holin family protein, partial [Singulisphaera rosea]
LLLTGVAVLLASGVAAVFATLRFTRSFESFRRSREEFTRNLSWIRTVLVYSGRAAPRRRF